jgi:hypothetical protein
MTSARPLFFVVLLSVLSVAVTSAFAADEKAQQQSLVSQQNQAIDPALVGRHGAGEPASDLFFLKGKPRLNFAAPAGHSRSAVLNDADCYTMRMYKVKRKEHFADGESGLRGYTTCELASNYQVHSAIAHVRTLDSDDLRSDAPQK